MFGRRKREGESAAPEADLRCSFCRKTAQEVRKLIAGPLVWICDECVDVCVGILADDRRVNNDATDATSAEPLDVTRDPWPLSDAWCSFCHKVADLEAAFMVENRVLLCGACVDAIAQAAAVARGSNGAE